MGYLGPSLCPRRRETALDATVSPDSRDVQRTFCLVVDEFGIFGEESWLVLLFHRYPDIRRRRLLLGRVAFFL